MLQGFAAINKRLGSGGVLTGLMRGSEKPADLSVLTKNINRHDMMYWSAGQY